MSDTRRRADLAPVCWRSDVVIHLGDGDERHAWVDLVGGRDRHSVGGEIAERPRWWRGRLEWLDDVAAVQSGTRIELELDGGRRVTAVVDRGEEAESTQVTIRGVGAPPFDVDRSARSSDA